MKTKNLLYVMIVVTLGLVACGPKQFYEMTPNGLEYYFFEKEKEAKMGEVGDIYNINITATTRRDSLLFNEHAMFKRHASIYPGDFHEGLSMLHVGDSVGFILNIDSFFGMHNLTIPRGLENDSMFKLLIGVENILSPLDHLIYKSEQELVKMKEYVAKNGWEVQSDSTGIMHEVIEEGTSDEYFQIGDSVNLSYVYSTLEGRIIEKTKTNDVWKFEVGGMQTTVFGLSRLLTLMKDGQRVRALIPFAEAFGEDGYGPMVPPYTTLVLELKADKIK